MKLIIGLGNPGKKYELTRHNCGFMTLNRLASSLNIEFLHDECQGLVAKTTIYGEKVILFKPLTFMNLSGNAVQSIVHFYKIDINDILVVYDDMSLPVGKIRLRESGSSGGHRGMQNIIDALSTQEIKRIRIGIDEPEDNAVDYVLSKFSKQEAPLVDISIQQGVEAIKDYLKNDFHHAMSTFN